MAMTRSPDVSVPDVPDIHALHQAHLAGESLATIGARLGVSHEAVRQWFLRHGLSPLSPPEMAEITRLAKEQRAEQLRDEVIALYQQHGTIDAVASEVDLPRRLVTEIIDSIPNRESFRKRTTYTYYSREELVSHLQRAAELKGEPLTIPNYRAAAKELGLAAYDSVINHFRIEDGEQPWLAALNAAGIQGNPPRGRHAGAYTWDDCIDAVRQCIEENGGRVSYAKYREWVADKGLPSGPSVRSIVGWNLAMETALDSLG